MGTMRSRSSLCFAERERQTTSFAPGVKMRILHLGLFPLRAGRGGVMLNVQTVLSTVGKHVFSDSLLSRGKVNRKRAVFCTTNPVGFLPYTQTIIRRFSAHVDWIYESLDN